MSGWVEFKNQDGEKVWLKLSAIDRVEAGPKGKTRVSSGGGWVDLQETLETVLKAVGAK